MKTMLTWPIAISCALWLLASCQPKKNKSAENPVSESSSAVSSTGQSEMTSRYWRLTGSIGAFPIVMDLAFRAPLDDDSGYYGYHGSYYYQSKEDLIDLYGMIDSVGNLILTEVTLNDLSPSFTGQLDVASGTYKGTWTSGDGKRSYPFELKEDYSDGAVAFRTQSFQDHILLFSGKKEASPSASYGMVWLSPIENTTDPATAKFLTEAIRKGMIGDSLAAVVSSPEEAFSRLSKSFFASYREDMGDISPDEIDQTGYMMFSYEENHSVEVFYNRNQLLTLGFWTYWFGGGAHGNYATELRSYDLQNRKELLLEDVFLPGYDQKLTPYLDKAARSKFSIPKNEPLGNTLFENTIPATENFGLTGRGVVFNYPPYEIAAYAMGEIRLFVPYSDIKHLLQPAFVERFVR